MPNDNHVGLYKEEIEAIQRDAVSIARALSPEQLAWQPGPGRWSVAQCLNHLAVSVSALLPILNVAIRKARIKGMTGHGPFNTGLLGSWFIRTQEPPVRRRMKNPRTYDPVSGRQAEQVLPEFIAAQNRLKQCIENADGLNLSRVMAPSPVSRLVRFNLATWFAATAAHERRHLWQARQTMAMKDFPPAPAGYARQAEPNVAFVPLSAAGLDNVLGMMKEYYACDGLDFSEPRARTGLEESLRDARLGSVWHIFSGTSSAGYMILGYGYSVEFGGRIAFVDELFVVPEHRGKGVGSRALAFAEDTCRSLGIHALRLEVTHHNEAARDLYRRKGFAEHDRYLMSRPLQP